MPRLQFSIATKLKISNENIFSFFLKFHNACTKMLRRSKYDENKKEIIRYKFSSIFFVASDYRELRCFCLLS